MKKFLLIFSVLLLAAVTGCGDRSKKTSTDDAIAYSPFVEGFTSGKISRQAPVYLIFNQDIPEEKMNVADLPKLIKMMPFAQGEFAFENSRTIVFKPASGGFKRDQSYKVVADLSKWFDVGSGKAFTFTFSTHPLALRANFESITTQSESEGFTVVCTVLTPDKEDGPTIESLIRISEQVEQEWEHSTDGKRHQLTMRGVRAEDKKRKIDLTVGPNKLGVEQENLLSVSIPGRNDFAIYNIAFYAESGRYVEITFTEQLDEEQNLDGIAYLEDNKSELYTITDNKIRLYPDAGREGVLNVFLGEAIRSKSGLRLGEDVIRQVNINTAKPSVRFVGNGVIIPQSERLTVPFEAVNLRGVIVKVLRIFENNIGYFLQENSLDNYSDLTRVGRLVARKIVWLDEDGDNLTHWNTFAIDLAELIKPQPGAVYRVELSYNLDLSAYPCEDVVRKSKEQLTAENEAKFKSDLDKFDKGYYYDSYEYDWYNYDYRQRDNPCHPTYYNNAYTGRNVLASNFGIIAKQGDGKEMMVMVHNLITTDPEAGVTVTLYNYQNQPIGSGVTNEQGRVRVSTPSGVPYYIVASQGNHRGYLHVNMGRSLSMSSFDVSGEIVQRGIKGFIYGERGVWRPGDTVHLGFMLNNRSKDLPANLPVTLELHNPLGQLYVTNTQTTNELGLYTFAVPIEADAPTGAWNAKVSVGGAVFGKRIRIETVKPNRLKIDLRVPEAPILGGVDTQLPLHVEWLQGATARNLEYEVEASFVPIRTSFDSYPGYVFDDPARRFEQESILLDSGQTDEQGDATVDVNLTVGKSQKAAGMMHLSMLTRVYEESGDFSIDGTTAVYSPYTAYAGIKSPQAGRSQLNTGTQYIFDLALVGHDGKPIPEAELEVDVYKVNWYWWWSSDNGSLANYISNSHNKPVKNFAVKTNSRGEGSFNLEFPNKEWGTYYIRVKHKAGGHVTGIMSYFDWPNSYGRREMEGSDDPTRLSISTDKASYSPGEVMTVVFPSTETARAIVSIENGTQILSVGEHKCSDEETTVKIPVTAEMQPNAYVHITLLQPHGETTNDLPIRLYGVVPFEVSSQESRLTPVIGVKDELRPEETYEVSVSEKSGRQMSYTLAIVDEGLLDLTKFRTPDSWRAFNAREALGVTTWDMYSYVMGAYGGRIEQIFSIGGDDEAAAAGQSRKINRFTPVVHFDGPYLLRKGETRRHNYTMPNYNGRVRVMVVAGDGSAYGNAEKSVMVRKPVMLLGTLPRVIGIGEEMVVPATVFATEKGVGKVSVSIQTSGNMTVQGSATQELNFTETGDKMAAFRIAVGSKPGRGTVKITANGKGETSVYETDIEIRSVRRPQTQVESIVLEPGSTWAENVKLPGADGTNSLSLEVSSIQPINIVSRLDYLVGYPHGCIEQITSKGFPQLYLWQFTYLTPEQEKITQEAIKEVIRRMRSYQNVDGAFSYWPGGSTYYGWATNYATHFLIEAENMGYLVPDALKRGALRNLSRQAKAWKPETSYYARSEEYTQAYRLYVLALAGSPEMGAMNRLKEREKLFTMTRWTLAAAYAKAGRSDVSKTLIEGTEDISVSNGQCDRTFGSETRDQAMKLITLCAMGETAKAAVLVNEISQELGSNNWMSTQTTAFSLMAVAEYMRKYPTGGDMVFNYRCGPKSENVKTHMNVWSEKMYEMGAPAADVEFKNNSRSTLFARVIKEGTPDQGAEESYANAIALDVNYQDPYGNAVTIDEIEQGVTFTMQATIKNTTGNPLNNLVLSQIVPAGWEIVNTRFMNEGEQGGSDNSDSQVHGVDYQDFRDDRVYSYIDYLPANRQVKVSITVTTVYPGTFYLPPVYCEAMYDNLVRANTEGRQTVVK